MPRTSKAVPTKRRAAWVVLGVTLLLSGCTGGMHRRGDQQLSLHGSFDTAIKGEPIWPDGEGRADNTGVTLGHNYFFRDRLAFMTHLTPWRVYNQSDGDAHAAELQIGFRYYFAEFGDAPAAAATTSGPADAAAAEPRPPVGLYAEVLGGIMNGSRSVPEEGSHSNFTQDTGLGVEVRLTDNVSWLTGYRLRHLSNGRIFRSDSNPSQNDHQVYTGLAISLE